MTHKVSEQMHILKPLPVKIIGYDGEDFYFADIDENGKLKSRIHLWNVQTWEWEAATKGTGTGQTVSVENFPAVISGATVPITASSLPLPSGAATDAILDPIAKYKVTDIDSAGATKYFGYVDADGNWYIMELTSTTGRYVKGSSGYTTNWDHRGDPLAYDYFYNIF